MDSCRCFQVQRSPIQERISVLRYIENIGKASATWLLPLSRVSIGQGSQASDADDEGELELQSICREFEGGSDGFWRIGSGRVQQGP